MEMNLSGIRKALGGWISGTSEAPPRIRRRGFDAAATGRSSSDWSSTEVHIDSDLRSSIKAVRARARYLSHNNDYAKRFVSLVRSNVVGPNGFKLQVQASDYRMVQGAWKLVQDKLANQILENAFYEWSKPENCTVSGRQSFRALCDMAMRYAARDGEFFVRMVRMKNVPYGFRLQFVDPMNVDDQYTTRLQSGNVVKMGVEMDLNRRPVAYYVKKTKPETEIYGYMAQGGDYERIPASEMIHGYDQEYEGQTRGISWMVQSMWRLKMLQGYEEAAVVKARVAASDMAYFIPGVDSNEQGTMQGNAVDADGNVVMDAEPGGMRTLPAGWDVKTWDHGFPSQQHEMFVNGTLRGISSGLGVSFNTFANNLEKVNYSSIRAGVIDERELWKSVQIWFTESLLEPVFGAWLEMAILTDSVNLPMSKYDKFNQPKWSGRRWPWVDPEKDVRAQLISLEAGLTTRAKILGEQGEDLEETLSALEEEKKLIEQYGLEFTTNTNPAPPAQDKPEPDEDDTVSPNEKKFIEELLGNHNGNGH